MQPYHKKRKAHIETNVNLFVIINKTAQYAWNKYDGSQWRKIINLEISYETSHKNFNTN